MVNEDLTSSLKLGTIHIWQIETDDQPYDILSLEKLLSTEEIDRSSHYRFELDRLRFVIRRGILRRLLSRYTGIDPVELKYFTSPHGKLSLQHHPLHFSVSHSQGRIGYAFSLEQEIGVDIEQVKPIPNIAHLAESWFSLEESAGLFTLCPSEQLDSFYHIWTQKEAFIKACGVGLAHPLQDFSVSFDPHNTGSLLSIKNNNPLKWKMVSYVPEPGWRVAVCVRSKSLPKVELYKATTQDFILPVY